MVGLSFIGYNIVLIKHGKIVYALIAAVVIFYHSKLIASFALTSCLITVIQNQQNGYENSTKKLLHYSIIKIILMYFIKININQNFKLKNLPVERLKIVSY